MITVRSERTGPGHNMQSVMKMQSLLCGRSGRISVSCPEINWQGSFDVIREG